MQTKIETLTKEEAITKGYTHFVEEEGDRVVNLTSITEEDCQYYRDKKCYIVDMNSPMHYTISADTIKELISEHVSGQEEMVDEDDKLFTITETHDYSTLSNELNAKFAAYKYYEPCDILVTF